MIASTWPNLDETKRKLVEPADVWSKRVRICRNRPEVGRVQSTRAQRKSPTLSGNRPHPTLGRTQPETCLGAPCPNPTQSWSHHAHARPPKLGQTSFVLTSSSLATVSSFRSIPAQLCRAVSKLVEPWRSSAEIRPSLITGPVPTSANLNPRLPAQETCAESMACGSGRGIMIA